MDQGILDTITNLKNSGLNDSEIKNMLKDIGFEDNVIDEALNYKKTKAPEQKETESEVTEEIKEQKSNEDEIKKHSDTAKLASSVTMNVAQNASDKLDAHKESMQNMNTKINDLSSGFERLPTKEHIEEIKTMHSSINEKNTNLDKKVDALDAKMESLTKIMKDILESQRDILMRLR